MFVSCPEFVLEANDCIFGLARPSLIEIIDIEPTRSKIVFWAVFGGSWLLAYLSIYLARTIFVLAVVEDERDVVRRDKANAGDDSLSTNVEDALQESPGNDEDGLQHGLLFRQHEPEIRPFHQVVLSTLLRGSYRTVTSILSLIRHLFWSPKSQQILITRDLKTSIRQLRYCSGNSSFLFRALLVYVIWWMVLPRALSVTISGTFSFLEFFSRSIFGFIFFKSSDTKPLTTWPTMAMIRIVGSLFFQSGMAFHTFRVLSASTGFSTNFVAEYLRDRRSRYPYHLVLFDPALVETSLWHIFYGFCETVPSLAYYFMTRPLDISRDFYYTDDQRTENFLLSVSSTRKALANAILVWLCLSGVTLSALGILVRIHATYVPSDEPTVVSFSRTKHKYDCRLVSSSERASFRRIRTVWAAWTIWIPSTVHIVRIWRILLQLLMLLSVIACGIYLAIRYLVQTLKNGDLFADWLARSYLEPDASITVPGVVWNFAFWHEQVLWAYNPGYPRRGTEFAFSGLKKRPNINSTWK